MSIFKTKGFDTVISKDTYLSGELCFSGTAIIEGTFDGLSIKQNAVEPKKSALFVHGAANVEDVIIVNDLTITGNVVANEVRVEGTLALKSGCRLKVNTIYYRTLVAEPGAVILGNMKHLDHVSEGEQV